jgi:hypothetical protein
MVANAFGWSEPVTGQTFQDVPPTNVFYNYIGRLYGRGIINGYPCGGPGLPCVPPDNLPYFKPGNNVTRGQTAKIVAWLELNLRQLPHPCSLSRLLRRSR